VREHDGELEAIVKMSPSQLRARHAGLAKVCKRLGIAYPIQQQGISRETRRFWLDEGFADAVLRLAGKT
jgi:hypothetical protein